MQPKKTSRKPAAEFEPVRRNTLSDSIMRQLQRMVLAGDFRPGDKIPPERELVRAFGVNRSSVREALRRLAEKGLVETMQGAGTVVLDYTISAGLDLLEHMFDLDDEHRLKAIEDLLETRLLLSPEIARLAALRRDGEGLAMLKNAVERLHATTDERDRQLIDWEIFEILTRNTDNIVYRFIINPIRAAYLANLEAFHPVAEASARTLPHYDTLLKAVEARDEKRAAQSMRKIIDITNAAIIKGAKAGTAVTRHQPSGTGST